MKKSEKIDNNIIRDEMKRNLPKYMLGILFHCIVIYILFKIPQSIGNILDLLSQENINKDLIMNEMFWLIFYSTIWIFPRIIFMYCYFTVGRTSEINLRSKVMEYLKDIKPEYYEREDKNIFLAYLSKELREIRRGLGNIYYESVRIIFTPILAVTLIILDFNIILITPIIIFLPFIGLRLIRLYKVQKIAVEKSRKVYLKLSKTIEQNTSGFSLIKLYNEQENQKQEFNQVNEEMCEAEQELGESGNKIENTTSLVYALAFSLAFILGLIMVSNNYITVGELTAYMSYISMAMREVVKNIKRLLATIPAFEQGKRRHEYFFDLGKYKKDGKKLEKVDTLEIKNLSYSYNEYNSKLALENINISIKKGEKIGIVGLVGSGKTTLMNIIAGLYEIEDNRIYINGIDVNEYSRKSIFENIGYTMQKTIISDDNIKNNIDIVGKNSNENILEATKKSDIYEDIQKMENGIETRIGENGIKTSTGQKQRIQVARHLLNLREINIFDDTLSGLDIETEKKVIKEIIRESKDKSLIIVSNKISMMKDLDKVYMLVDGKIEAHGNHNELLKNNDLYKQLSDYEKVGESL